MAENIYFNLTEEIEGDLLGRYQALCDDLTQKLNAMEQELEGLCSQTQYEPMLKVVNHTIDLFNGDIYDLASQVFDGWIDGSGSFKAAVKTSQAGDAALETAGQIEQNIRDLFDGFWSAHPLGEGVQLDTRRPNIKAEDFDELKEIYTRFFQEVDGINGDTINQITELGNDDPTYNVIIPAIRAIAEPMKNAFEQFCSKVDEAKEKSEKLKQQQDANNDEASEAATTTSASVVDIAEALKMFDDI